ncbi:MAG TPA: DUF1269 domain-containing protein [Burkholderiales bacterium]
MRRRLYFLLPDVPSTERTVDDLLLARIEDRRLHVLAKRGTDLGRLHEANALQKTDLIHGAEIGMMVGALGGLLVGLFVVMTPPEGVRLEFVTVLITCAAGAVLGSWASSLIGVSVPNSRLTEFERDIEAGRILLMVDAPASRVDEIREMVLRRHPEAMGGKVEPTLPAFP